MEFAYWLVHNAEEDLGLGHEVGSQLAPQARELSVCWSALSDDPTVPSGVVVHIHQTQRGAGVHTTLDELVVVVEVALVKRSTELIIDKVLPRNWQAECVETIRLDEVVHLIDTILAWRVGLWQINQYSGKYFGDI